MILRLASPGCLKVGTHEGTSPLKSLHEGTCPTNSSHQVFEEQVAGTCPKISNLFQFMGLVAETKVNLVPATRFYG